jgi:hypothetical protein
MPQSLIIIKIFKYRKWIYSVLALPFVVGSLYQLIYSYLYPLPYISWPKLQLIFVPLGELLLLVACFDIYFQRSTQKNKSTLGWQLGFLISNINLVFIYRFAAYYEGRSQYQSAQLVLSGVPAAKVLFSVFTVVCFFIGFRKYLVYAWKSFSFAEEARQKRTWITVVILGIGFVVGIGLRIYNLGGFPPYIDEYIHTHDAVAIMNGEPLEWGRSYLTVSLPVYVSYLIFGVSIWASRLPMVLINMLAIFPLYALLRKVNKWVGYIGVALFVFSPWIIAASRTVRDYAVVPFFFYLAGFLLVDLLDWESLSFIQYINKHKYRLAGAIMILGYSIYDNNSILKIILAVYGVFAFIVILKTLSGHSSRWIKISVLSLVGLMIILLAAQSGIIHHILPSTAAAPVITGIYWNALINGNFQQWYVWNELGYLILFVGCFFAIRAGIKRYEKIDFIALFGFMVFAAILGYLTFFLVNPHVPARTRYGVLMEYWLLIIAAMTIYYVFHEIRRVVGRNFSMFPLLVITGLFFNYLGIHMVLTYQGGGRLQITDENHYIVEPAYRYIIGRLSDQDVLITDVLERYDEITGQQFRNLDNLIIYHWIFRGDETPMKIIEQNPHGWIAVTPNDLPATFNLPFSDFNFGGIHFQYIGVMGEIYIWHWDQAAP